MYDVKFLFLVFFLIVFFQVTYESAGMIEKNKDTLFKDLLETIKLSDFAYVSFNLFT